jgi:hypothetical protein
VIGFELLATETDVNADGTTTIPVTYLAPLEEGSDEDEEDLA